MDRERTTVSRKSEMTYKVAILVGFYESGEYISAKLDNLKRQTIFNDCIFIFLNCQNKHNERSYYTNMLTDNVIEILYDTHKWLYETWNDGIKSSESKYICNSNADDMWHPKYLEKCYNHLEDNENIGILSTNVLITNKPNQSDHTKWKYSGKLPDGIYPSTTAGPSPMWRRSLHDKYGYFGNYRTIGDARIWETWHTNNEKFSRLDEDLVLYYSYRDSLERRIDKETGKTYRELDLND